MSKRARFILGGVMLLFMVGVYVALGIAIDASVRDLIPLWPLWVSLIVEIVAIFVGFWYMPEQRRTPTIVALAITWLILQGLTIHVLSSWYMPMLATAVVIIICVAVFWPVNNNTTRV